MKSCRFHDPDFITMYYEGVLDEEMERAFSDHLLTCSECMESLLHLESDLALMHSMKLSPLPEAIGLKGAVFQLVHGKLRILQNLIGELRFQPLLLSPMRGKDGADVHQLEKGGIRFEIEAEGENSFKIELDGVRGKSFFIKQNNRMIERHADEKDEKVAICNLKRGSFSLFINDEKFTQFIVQ